MKILVNDQIAGEAMELLRARHEVDTPEFNFPELLDNIDSYDAVIVRSRTEITSEVIQKGRNLRVIGRAGVGVDNIDVDAATERRIPVVFSPRGSTVSVAELAIGHMISLARDLVRADVSVRNGKWEKKRLMGTELFGKTLGLVGAGRIGTEVAARAHAFGMKVIAFDPYLPPEVAEKHNIELVEFLDLLKQADFISIHAVLTPETRGLIGENQLEMMKSTAFLVNCARGGIIDESALTIAIEAKHIAGAALDVFENEPLGESELTKYDRIHFTPHLGASTREAQVRAGTIVAEQVLKVLDGERPDQIVNKKIYD